MAIVIPQKSVFSDARGQGILAAVTPLRETGRTYNFKAAQDIQRGADIDVELATADAVRNASVATGLETEYIQDQIANLAHTHYDQYLAYKQEVLSKIRSEVLRTFITNKKMYEDIGYTDLQAEKMAKDIAQEVKAAQMKIYDVLFPRSGQKVKDVY